MPPKLKWYYGVWPVLIGLFFLLGPLGLPLLWRSPYFPKWAKWILTSVVILLTVVFLMMMVKTVKFAVREAQELRTTLP